jgi:hypothetical protein
MRSTGEDTKKIVCFLSVARSASVLSVVKTVLWLGLYLIYQVNKTLLPPQSRQGAVQES